MVVLFCLGKITQHGILTTLICSVPPALHFMCNGSPDHCQDEADKGLRADGTTEQAVQVFFSQLASSEELVNSPKETFLPRTLTRHLTHLSLQGTAIPSVHMFGCLNPPPWSSPQHLLSTITFPGGFWFRLRGMLKVQHFLTTWPLSRIPSTTVIRSGTACSSSAPTTDPAPQGKEPGTAPEVSPQTSPVTASPVRPSTPATAISSTWCCTLTAEPTAGSSCAVPCWSARQPRAASSFPPETSAGSEQSGWAGAGSGAL